jgi:hypothetical protein
MESLRFRRAIYRIWLYATALGGEELFDSDIEDEDDILQLARQDRYKFLNVFSSGDLLELDAAAAFLNSITKWIMKAEGIPDGDAGVSRFLANHNTFDNFIVSDRYIDGMLALGPCHILRIFRGYFTGDVLDDIGIENVEYPLCEKFLSLSLDDICEERKLNRERGEYSKSLSILDEVNGEHDQCSRRSHDYSG